MDKKLYSLESNDFIITDHTEGISSYVLIDSIDKNKNYKSKIEFLVYKDDKRIIFYEFDDEKRVYNLYDWIEERRQGTVKAGGEETHRKVIKMLYEFKVEVSNKL